MSTLNNLPGKKSDTFQLGWGPDQTTPQQKKPHPLKKQD
jgi:hypothetical protein